ncbi:MAG: hypothetical protein GC202_05690 [Alphaproteobacteria bacterium]|nr:hypothetical protein [Alphaproteobacteria bacterium]
MKTAFAGLAIGALALGACVPDEAGSGPATGGAPASRSSSVFEFESPHYPNEGQAVVAGFLKNEPSSTVRITGQLLLPPGAKAPVPMVIVAHTSAGPKADVPIVASAMRAAGFATLTYHSFAPRKFGNNGDASQSGGGPRLEMHLATDAYLALKALAADQRIDIKRVAIVGLSAGGNGAMLASSESMRKRYVGADGPRFAALVAIYPGGYLLPLDKDVSSQTPLLLLPAENDTLMPWKRTKVWVDHVLKDDPSKPVSYKVVPGAHHSFLNDGVRAPPNVPGAGTCPYTVVELEGPSAAYLHVNGAVNQFPDMGCQTRGATMEYSASASSFAINETVAFLKKRFAEID